MDLVKPEVSEDRVVQISRNAPAGGKGEKISECPYCHAVEVGCVDCHRIFVFRGFAGSVERVRSHRCKGVV